MVSFTETIGKPRNRLAISALAAAVVLFVVIGIAAELTFLPKASSPGGVATTSPPSGGPGPGSGTPSKPVKDAVNQFIQDFNTRNVGDLSGFYASDASVDWSGNAGGLTGVYNGQGQIRILYGGSIGKTIYLNASLSNYNEHPADPANVNVTMTINMKGNSSVVGTLDSTIDATQQWAYTGSWQIVKENWNYKTFNVQYPVSATTFPQWGALKAGKNPNLVSEKSFEWNAGPYIAASVYAFLAGIVAIGVVKYRSRPRRD